jgi:two-component system response regulator FixJ
MVALPTVAVVDDDEQVRESLAALVQSIEVEVACFATGREFLDNYVHERPGCVVLDLRMPEVGGMDVLRELAARHSHAPVIIITGHGDIPAAVEAMKCGAVDFLEKPYRGAALLDSVRRAIAMDEHRFEANAQRNELLSHYESLTNDERNVLWLTAEGKPDKAIALRLDLSLRTIQLRRASLMRKMGAPSRAALIRLAQSLEPLPAAAGSDSRAR